MTHHESLVDIEDCVGADSRPINNHVLPKVSFVVLIYDVVDDLIQALRRTKQKAEITGDSVIPGTQVVYVKTWGCSHNNSDGEYMIGQLSSYGYSITGGSIT